MYRICFEWILLRAHTLLPVDRGHTRFIAPHIVIRTLRGEEGLDAARPHQRQSVNCPKRYRHSTVVISSSRLFRHIMYPLDRRRRSVRAIAIYFIIFSTFIVDQAESAVSTFREYNFSTLEKKIDVQNWTQMHDPCDQFLASLAHAWGKCLTRGCFAKFSKVSTLLSKA